MQSKRRCREGRGSCNGLLILILILLQFGCCRERGCHDEGLIGRGRGCEIDNSILFIIVLFFLCCCGDFSLCCC
ncbi:hypothetical protein C1149_12460 [Clostridium botulinum]|nr:hypothetical protein C1149_12460 [Clostridium botulinum]